MALSASGLTAFATSTLFRGKFSMEDIQNATLAGGVAVGSSSDLIIKPYNAFFIGILAGFISTLGFAKLKKFLYDKIGLHDTCGIHNLHGMPGLLGGIVSAMSTAAVNDNNYSGSFTLNNNQTISNLIEIFPKRANRSALQQGMYQFIAVAITLIIAIVSGLIVGKILNSSYFDKQEYLFDDSQYFEGVASTNDSSQSHKKSNVENNDQ